MKAKKHLSTAAFRVILEAEVSTALRQWGQVVVAHAAAHAPIDTGALRRSLTVSEIEKHPDGTMRIKVGPDHTVGSYAPRQELDLTLGFGRKSVAAGATRPWLRPAFFAARRLGQTLVRAAFKRSLKV